MCSLPDVAVVKEMPMVKIKCIYNKSVAKNSALEIKTLGNS